MDVFVPHTIRISKVVAPPSKSHAQRILLAASLSDIPCKIKNTGNSADVKAMLNAIDALGAVAYDEKDYLLVQGGETALSNQLHCGESGLGTRLVACVAPLFFDRCEIHGEGSLLKRPMSDLEKILPQFGVQCTTVNGLLPLTLSGRLKGGHVKIDASSSSQYLSGLLMALPLCKEDSVLEITALSSKPYVDMTLEVLGDFGIKTEHENHQRFLIKGNQEYIPQQNEFVIEGDYSGAAAWLVLAAATGKTITLEGLKKKSAQADRALLGLLEKTGAAISWKNDAVTISNSNPVPFEFDATDCPDLFPVLVVLAAAATGTSTIKGTNRLRHKESDRATVLQKEFGKTGLRIEIENDVMTIYGTGKLDSATIDSNNDHRIAMAGAIAAALTDKGITVLNAEAVTKSYPGFWSIING